VYQLAFEAGMLIFEVTKRFPAEAGVFVNNLNDSEAETAETQTWLEFVVKCDYLDAETGRALYQTYDHILGKLVNMIRNPSPWPMLRK